MKKGGEKNSPNSAATISAFLASTTTTTTATRCSWEGRGTSQHELHLAQQMAMTTSMTRSRRAGEGLHPSHPQAARHPQKQQQQQQLVGNAKNGVTTTAAVAHAQGSPNNLVHANLHHRRKRSLDASARDFDPIIAKKARFAGIAVEIPSRSSFHSRSAREATGTGTNAKATKAAAAPQHHHHQQQQQQQRQQLQPPPPPPTPKVYKQTPASSTKSVAFATTAAAVARPNGHGHAASRTAATSTSTIIPPPRPPIAKTATTARGHKQPQHHQQKQQQPALTKHKEKVVNGLKHELNRLQPSSADIKSQGRKLRSQEATRFKSELSAYFPDYDEVIGNEPKEQREHGTGRFASLFLELMRWNGNGWLTFCSSHFNRYLGARNPHCNHQCKQQPAAAQRRARWQQFTILM